MSVVVLSAGLRVPSSTRLLADRLAAAVRAGGVPADVVDLREYAHEIANTLLTGFPSGELREVVERVRGAGGLVAVTPIFNASYSGLFKSFVDILDEGTLAGKPVLIAATGGTARHSLALEFAVRPLFAYLRAVVTPTAVFAAPEDWAGGAADGALAARVNRAAGELVAELARRPATAPADPFALTTTFDQLLAD
jgi:FMN reductase